MSPDTPRWVRDAVFYQVFPDRFAASARVAKPGPMEPWDAPPTPYGFKGGDLLGIVERLDHLADLGVTALYLTPIFASASNHRYHTYDYFEVDPLLGGNAALRELVDALHARGMRIVLDGVFNHTGRGFWPFHHVAETGLGSPYLDWFHLDRDHLAAGHGLQPYPPPGEPGRLGYAAWWNLPALPKLNVAHPPVREFLWSVAEHWLRFGIDGWRLDVPAEIDDEPFWREFRRRCRAVNPEAYLVGEIWHVAPEWLRGDRFDALMNYPLMEAILAFVTRGEPDRGLIVGLTELAKAEYPRGAAAFAERLVELGTAYEPATVAAQLNLLSSHDMPRFRTLAGGGAARLRLGTLLQMALPGAPCVYYGDEIGMEGGRDPDCRRAFPAGAEGRDEGIRATVRALIAARRAHPALRSDRVTVLAAEGDAILLERGGAEDPTAAGERAWVAANAGDAPVRLSVPAPRGAGTRLAPLAIPGLAPARDAVAEPDGTWTLEVPPGSGAVYPAR